MSALPGCAEDTWTLQPVHCQGSPPHHPQAELHSARTDFSKQLKSQQYQLHLPEGLKTKQKPTKSKITLSALLTAGLFLFPLRDSFL